MPIYEYQCEACGKGLEKLQKFSDPVLTNCPACDKESLKKKISATSFRLKGTGWYETDFKTSQKKHGTDDKSDKLEKSDKSAKSGNDSADKPVGNTKDSSSSSAGEKTKAKDSDK